jgi:GNAT superfamily N-acetyltransferase
MWWRVPRGGKLWEESKGARNQRAFKKLVVGGQVHGCLAFADGEPVGWCCVGPRSDFPRIERVKGLQVPWNEDTWSVTCFYIRAGWRRKGVARALLAGAVDVARAHGAKEIHGYPVKPKRPEGAPAAFAWTGVPRLFEACRFVEITLPEANRPVYRRGVRRTQ